MKPLDVVITKVKTLKDLLIIRNIIVEDSSEATIEDLGLWLEQWESIDIYCASLNSWVVGFVVMYRGDPTLLDVIYVLPKYRSQGIGKLLLDKVKSVYKGFVLIVNSRRAEKFYKREGLTMLNTAYNMLGYNQHANQYSWGEI